MCPYILCVPGCNWNTRHCPLVQGLASAWFPTRVSSPAPPTPMPIPPTPALQGYSFVAPSILFDHNNAVMTDVLEAPGAGDPPGRAAVARSAMMQVGWAGLGGNWF